MKSAFTLIELVFIIIIVGIIGVTAVTTFKKDTLTPATIQVLDHIRYTQQLALNQDMFTPSQDFAFYNINSDQSKKDSKQWFKKWWQIQFHSGRSYTIYSDHPTTGISDEYNNNPDISAAGNLKLSDIVAKDPNTQKYIFGHITGSSTPEENERLTIVDLKTEFNVDIAMTGCGTSKHLLFDDLGRPHCAKSQGSASNNPYDRIVSSEITVCVYNSDNSNMIHIVPITGFASISWDENCP